MKEFSNLNHMVNYTRKIFTNSGVGVSAEQLSFLAESCQKVMNLHEILIATEINFPRLRVNYIPKAFANHIGLKLDLKIDVFDFIEKYISKLTKVAETFADGKEIDYWDLDWLMNEGGTFYLDEPRQVYQGEFSDEFLEEYYKGEGVYGVYFIFNEGKELIYVGKSGNLFSRLSGSLVDRKGTYYAYAIPNTMADMHIYEIYYINKYKPVLNKDSLAEDELTIELPEIKVSDMKIAFKEGVTHEQIID